MLKLNYLIRSDLKLNSANLSSLANKQQQPYSKRSKQQQKNEIQKKEIKLPNSITITNRRLIRTNIGRALVNRIYFRFEIYKSDNNFPWLRLNDSLIERVLEGPYRKYHNLVQLDEVLVDKMIQLYSNRETKQMTRRALQYAEIVELDHLAEKTGKTRAELYKSGLEFDRDGCPNYGSLRNTMFLEYDEFTKSARNFHRLLESSLYNPKFCFDFYPCYISSFLDQNIIFYYLRYMFRRNIESLSPFNVHFTNYNKQNDHRLKAILTESESIPDFVDIQVDHLNDRVLNENKKLIVIMKDKQYATKEIYYDHEANYFLPAFITNSQVDRKAQNYYINRFSKYSNVEFVYVPTRDYIDEESTFNFAFYYLVVDSLKNGLEIGECIRNAFYNYRKQAVKMNQDPYFAMVNARKLKNGNFELKKFKFKEFDNLEDDLT